MNGNSNKPTKKRTHIGISPTSQMSPYSDTVDNGGESFSFDEEIDSVRGNTMRFFDIDVEKDHNLHDQLPSVDEAKANIHFDAVRNQHGKRPNKKLVLGYILWGILVFGGFGLVKSRMGKRKKFYRALDSVTATVRISQPDAFLDSESPQSRALSWMLHEDPLQLPLPSKRSDRFVQRYVIAVLVFALTTETTETSLSPEPSSQRNTRKVFGLLSGVHECEWNWEWDRVDFDGEQSSVVDEEEHVTLGIICGFSDETWNDDGVSNESVTGILFRRSGLHGELPPELENLKHLSKVDLANNEIEGTVPPMPYLKELSLAYNQLTGNLPDHFSEMNRLRVLSLSENALQGRLPQKFKALTNLEVLALNGNQLTGGLEEIYPLTNVEELYLAYNVFEDHLENDSFKNLSSLRVVDAKDNRLSGPLPDALWKLTHLEVIDFHKNSLDGHINNVIVENHPLKYLDVSNNILGGGLPTSISNLNGLTHLDVSYNRLEARIPNDHLKGMTNMRTLLLTEEDGTGPQPIPDWIRGMTDLKQLSFRLTARTGTIPTWFGELTQLELLDLDWNHISGTIPTELGLLTNLKYLMLNRNWLTGTVPTVVSFLPNLKVLMLDTNGFDRDIRTGDEDVCGAQGVGRIESLIADCGVVEDGVLLEQEVECPCCTNCCWDSAHNCNMKDWIIELETEYRSTYDRCQYDFDDAYYVPAS